MDDRLWRFCGLVTDFQRHDDLSLVFLRRRAQGFIKPKNEAWERDKVSQFLKTIVVLGIVLGIIMVATSILTMVKDIPPSFQYRDHPGDRSLGNHFDWLTSISLLVLGLAMFIKPLEDVPLATIIGLVAGAGVGIHPRPEHEGCFAFAWGRNGVE